MKFLSVIFVFLFFNFLSNTLVLADDSGFELTCRAKAKEAAAESYKVCVTESRSAQIEQLRKDYQQRLHQLKEDYEKDLQRVGGKLSSSSVGQKFQSTKNAVKNSRLLPSKKSAKRNSSDDMDIQIKPAHNAPVTDDSMMDIPEPVPVENMTTESAL